MKRWGMLLFAAMLAFAPAARAQSPADTEMPDYQTQPPAAGAQEIQVFPEVGATITAKPFNGIQPPSLEQAGRLAKKKDFPRAIETLNALPPTEDNAQKAARAYIRGLALKEMQQPAEAAPFLREAAADPLLGDWALLNAMEAYATAGQPGQVIAAADELYARFPYSPLAEGTALMKAKALMDTGLYAKAEILLKERLAKGAKAPERAYQLLAQCLEAEGKIVDAHAAWAEIWFGYPAAPFAADAKVQMDRLKSSGKGLFLTASAGKKLERAAALMQNRLYKDAVAYIGSLDKGSFTPGHRAELYLHLGRARERLGNKDDAMEAYNHAARAAGPKLRGEALYRAARISWNRDESGKTAELLNKILKESPNSDVAAPAVYMLGRLDESAGRRAEAIKKFERTASVYPSSPAAEMALWYAGWLRYMDGDYAGAETAFQRLADRDENSGAAPMALYWIIRSRQMRGNDFSVPLERLLKKYPLSYYTLLTNGGGISYRVPAELPAPPGGQLPETATVRIREGMGRFSQKPSLSPKGVWAYESALAWMRLGFTGRARDLLDIVAAETPFRRETRTWLAVQYHGAECYQCVFREADTILKENVGQDYLDFLSLLIFPVAHWRAVADEAALNKIDPFLILSVIRQESIFDPDIVSIADARGLMQVIPPTAARMARELGMESFTADQLQIPERNIAIGARYLAGLVKNEKGDLPLALATYNAGPNPVAKWKGRIPMDDASVFVERIPYTETREYVKKVLRNYGFYKKVYLELLGGARAQNIP